MGYAEDFVNYTSFLKAFSECIISDGRNTMTLDEKVEAILNLCTTMAVQIQKNTDEIKELRSDVTELRSDVRRLENRMETLEYRMETLEKGQKRIDERLAIMTDQIAGNQSRTKSIEERLMINDQRIQRLEDRIFPALAEAV